MKTVVFGASGRMGIKVVEQALEAGHIVTAFLRNPSKIAIQHPNLTLFQGDVMDASAVENAIAGQEVVISLLGKTRPPEPGMNSMLETAAKNIVAAMQKHGIHRIISTTGAGVPQPEDQPKVADRLVNTMLNFLQKNFVLDASASVKVIQSSDLDWTIVRFPRVTDGARTGKYRVAYIGKDSGTMISRADGADFVIRELNEKKWLRKAPVVSY
ncbi:MAG TPA: SDR family oxidoreductase [Anaerolineales bacterium]|jgi:putative NADH-flavin reductase